MSLPALAAVLADAFMRPSESRNEAADVPDPAPGAGRPTQARDTLRSEIALFERDHPGWRAADLGTQWVATSAGTVVHADTLHGLEQAVEAAEHEVEPERVRPYLQEHEDLPWSVREAAPPSRGGIAC